jgi:hypothetical protein
MTIMDAAAGTIEGHVKLTGKLPGNTVGGKPAFDPLEFAKELTAQASDRFTEIAQTEEHEGQAPSTPPAPEES